MKSLSNAAFPQNALQEASLRQCCKVRTSASDSCPVCREICERYAGGKGQNAGVMYSTHSSSSSTRHHQWPRKRSTQISMAQPGRTARNEFIAYRLVTHYPSAAPNVALKKLFLYFFAYWLFAFCSFAHSFARITKWPIAACASIAQAVADSACAQLTREHSRRG